MNVVELEGRRRVRMIFDDGSEKGRSFSASHIAEDVTKDSVFEIAEAVAEVLGAEISVQEVENIKTTHYVK